MRARRRGHGWQANQDHPAQAEPRWQSPDRPHNWAHDWAHDWAISHGHWLGSWVPNSPLHQPIVDWYDEAARGSRRGRRPRLGRSWSPSSCCSNPREPGAAGLRGLGQTARPTPRHSAASTAGDAVRMGLTREISARALRLHASAVAIVADLTTVRCLTTTPNSKRSPGWVTTPPQPSRRSPTAPRQSRPYTNVRRVSLAVAAEPVS